MASLQGYLMSYKTRAFQAVDDVEYWIKDTREVRDCRAEARAAMWVRVYRVIDSAHNRRSCNFTQPLLHELITHEQRLHFHTLQLPTLVEIHTVHKRYVIMITNPFL